MTTTICTHHRSRSARVSVTEARPGDLVLGEGTTPRGEGTLGVTRVYEVTGHAERVWGSWMLQARGKKFTAAYVWSTIAIVRR
jgi:hypothetical protein